MAMYFHLSDEYDPDADPADIAEEELSHSAEFRAKRIVTGLLPKLTASQLAIIEIERRKWGGTPSIHPRTFGC